MFFLRCAITYFQDSSDFNVHKYQSFTSHSIFLLLTAHSLCKEKLCSHNAQSIPSRSDQKLQISRLVSATGKVRVKAII